MKTNNIILIGTIFFVSMACSTTTEPIAGISSPGVIVSLNYVDENGNNLLGNDVNTPGAWNESNIDIYYLKKGEKVRVFESHQDNPKNFQIWHEDKVGNYLRLLLNPYVENNYSSTYIEFPDGEIDTLRIHAELIPDFGISADKFWYNEELLFSKEGEVHGDVGMHKFVKSIN